MRASDAPAARGGHSAEPEPRIVVATSRGAAVLPVREIDWIEAADNYARIWTGGRSYLLREPLRTLESRVEPDGFARAHRCALVRLAGSGADRSGPTASSSRSCLRRTRARSRRRRAAFRSTLRSSE